MQPFGRIFLFHSFNVFLHSEKEMYTTKAISTIVITDVVSGCSTNAEGFTLYTVMKNELANGSNVKLSFKDCPGMSSSFLNSSLGAIFDEKGIDFIKNRITLGSIKPSQLAYVREYLHSLASHNLSK